MSLHQLCQNHGPHATQWASHYCVCTQVLRGLKFFVSSCPAPAEIWKILPALADFQPASAPPRRPSQPARTGKPLKTHTTCLIASGKFSQWFISKPTEVFKKIYKIRKGNLLLLMSLSHALSQLSVIRTIFFNPVPRGVTRLDGARAKKQVWRPHVRT